MNILQNIKIIFSVYDSHSWVRKIAHFSFFHHVCGWKRRKNHQMIIEFERVMSENFLHPILTYFLVSQHFSCSTVIRWNCLVRKKVEKFQFFCYFSILCVSKQFARVKISSYTTLLLIGWIMRWKQEKIQKNNRIKFCLQLFFLSRFNSTLRKKNCDTKNFSLFIFILSTHVKQQRVI